MTDFLVESPFQPAGDQPTAIAALTQGVQDGLRYQTLEGITGSGKTATIAWLVEQVQRPTLILEPNKSLAAQLASELRDMLPKNRVEFFVSYYDYYQPEAYVPRTDTYIEKDSSVNEEIDRLRHAATSSLLTTATPSWWPRSLPSTVSDRRSSIASVCCPLRLANTSISGGYCGVWWRCSTAGTSW